MDVPISELRANLASWIDRAEAGEEVVITDRGTPVARLVGLGWRSALERLVDEGIVSEPVVRDKPQLSDRTRVRASGSVSDLISEQRR